MLPDFHIRFTVSMIPRRNTSSLHEGHGNLMFQEAETALAIASENWCGLWGLKTSKY
jgi:hypothetical protein